MVSWPRKIIIIMSIIILSILMITENSEAKNKNNDGNIEIIKLKQDELYLENLNDMDKIRQEMIELQASIENLEEDYVLSRAGIKVFPGNKSIENNILRTRLNNRRKKLEDPGKFKYNTSGRYIQTRGDIKDYGFEGYFSQLEMDRTQGMIVQVLDSLELDLDFLRTTSFVVSPYRIKSSNGYAVIRSNDINTIVISNKAAGQPGFEDALRSTILHEIGHIFGREELEDQVAGIYCQACSEDQAWASSLVETFAEEFRIITSSKLGPNSFKPYKNKTNLRLEPKDLDKLRQSLGAI